MDGPKVSVKVLAEHRLKRDRTGIYAVAGVAYPMLWDRTKGVAQGMDGPHVAEGVVLALLRCAVGLTKIEGADLAQLRIFLDAAWEDVQMKPVPLTAPDAAPPTDAGPKAG